MLRVGLWSHTVMLLSRSTQSYAYFRYIIVVRVLPLVMTGIVCAIAISVPTLLLYPICKVSGVNTDCSSISISFSLNFQQIAIALPLVEDFSTTVRELLKQLSLQKNYATNASSSVLLLKQKFGIFFAVDNVPRSHCLHYARSNQRSRHNKRHANTQ